MLILGKTFVQYAIREPAWGSIIYSSNVSPAFILKLVSLINKLHFRLLSILL